ncbi:MAG: glycosyltransferase [Chlamydiales bacterium]|nr:glycosyltransferase [Chlamydiales bacterium]
MKRVVVLADGFMNWPGGVDFFNTHVTALLATYPPEKMQITLLYPEKKCFSKGVHPFLKVPLLKQILHARARKKMPFPVAFSAFGKKRLNRSLRQLKADIACFCWSDVPVDTFDIGYYPDLQHKHFPQFFSEDERKNRDRTISNILKRRKRLITTSRAVKRDIEHFFPKTDCEVISLPFAPILLEREWLEPLTYDVRAKYSVPEIYFMISNQFWVHKGHRTAFEALSKLDSDVHLVCTGKEDDFRFPGYYKELLELIKPFRHRVHLLGHIPKRDQIELMKHSRAILQPTLFEGGPGGGSVQNALSLGVPVIISDIDVNREVEGDHVYFFEVQNSDDLCVKMRELLKNQRQKPSDDVLWQKREENIQKLGKALIRAINL